MVKKGSWYMSDDEPKKRRKKLDIHSVDRKKNSLSVKYSPPGDDIDDDLKTENTPVMQNRKYPSSRIKKNTQVVVLNASTFARRSKVVVSQVQGWKRKKKEARDVKGKQLTLESFFTPKTKKVGAAEEEEADNNNSSSGGGDDADDLIIVKKDTKVMLNTKHDSFDDDVKDDLIRKENITPNKKDDYSSDDETVCADDGNDDVLSVDLEDTQVLHQHSPPRNDDSDDDDDDDDQDDDDDGYDDYSDSSDADDSDSDIDCFKVPPPPRKHHCGFSEPLGEHTMKKKKEDIQVMGLIEDGLATELPRQDSTYRLIEQHFASFGVYAVRKILKITNCSAAQEYMLYRKTLLNEVGEQIGLNEKSLFHGTKTFDAVNGITREGFDWRLHGINGTLYGKGSYFSESLDYSAEGFTQQQNGPGHVLRYMFIARVLLGKSVPASQSDVRAPPGSHSTYTVVRQHNNNNAVLRMTFHMKQAYPQFLVCFERRPGHLQAQNGYCLSLPLLPLGYLGVAAGEAAKLEEEWACSVCTLLNKPFSNICEVCNTLRKQEIRENKQSVQEEEQAFGETLNKVKEFFSSAFANDIQSSRQQSSWGRNLLDECYKRQHHAAIAHLQDLLSKNPAVKKEAGYEALKTHCAQVYDHERARLAEHKAEALAAAVDVGKQAKAHLAGWVAASLNPLLPLDDKKLQKLFRSKANQIVKDAQKTLAKHFSPRVEENKQPMNACLEMINLDVAAALGAAQDKNALKSVLEAPPLCGKSKAKSRSPHEVLIPSRPDHESWGSSLEP